MFVEERKPDLGGVKYLTNLEVKIMCEEYTEEEEANAREAANVLVSLGFGSW